ncbi:DUF6797 domain-containing protein [Alienimonas chondri]|uniref:ThuA-like domain-containing protein n=1 Tax=Alienimonas chondri TaxID=2681879 RepID=A0ABX1VB18_9PLAN|nr:DUF6797 domain-containing protein [Alienimonas chondri]NNJ25300.1 hypothetical protein [Alienimonas chondri]
MLASAPLSLFLSAALLGAALAPPPDDSGGAEADAGEDRVRTVLLIAGEDDSHAAGTHEYAATVAALAEYLKDSNVGERLRVETAVGWPKDAAALDRADCVFLYSGGGDRDEKNHPLLVGDRWSQLEAAAARGCGVVLLHWSTFLPDRLHDSAMAVVGGRFDYEGGEHPKGWESRINFAQPTVTPTADHPVTDGVEPHHLHDEFYHHLSFPKAKAGWTPLLTAPLPEDDGTTSSQTVAWALERAVTSGGSIHRAVGFTGGHFEKNLKGEGTEANHRRFLMNAIAWSAGLEIPRGGVRTFDELWTPVSRTDAKLPYEVEKEPDWIDDRIRDMDPGPFFFSSLSLPDGEKILKGVAITVPGASPEEHVAVDTLTGVARCGWGGRFLEHTDRRYGLIDLPKVGGECVWSLPKTARWTVRDESGEVTPAEVKYDALTVDGPDVTLHFTIAGEVVRFLADENGTRYESGLGGEKLSPPAGGPGLRVRWQLGAPYADPAPRWTPLVTAGRLGKPLAESAEAFAVDTVDLPFDNPPNALLFLSGLGFTPDGTAYVAAAHGDVWQVRGLDGDLSQIEWRRFATGFYQPLGMTVRLTAESEPEIFALGRDRITKLIDVNGDGEADRYESFNADLDIIGQPHAYAMGLETDAEGNFYFLKSGSASTKQGGCLVQVTADGAEMKVVATGFRHPNGIGLSPEGSSFAGLVTAADNEGNWVPATPLHLIDPSVAVSDAAAAKYYAGFVPTAHREATIAFDQPALWMPRAVCTSAGGQCWVPCDDHCDEAWGSLAGSMLHLSYGRCTANLVLTEDLHVPGAPRAQGAVMPLPGVTFQAGVCRGRFFPGTADLWVCGLDGWQTAAVKDGCLQRLRRTDAPVRLPTSLKVHRDGLELRFATELAEEAADPANWDIEAWTYKRTADYGSPELRPSDPEQEGHDVWPVAAVSLSPDRRGAYLSIPRLEPVMQYSLHADLTAADAAPVPVRLFGTIHHAGDRWLGWGGEGG